MSGGGFQQVYQTQKITAPASIVLYSDGNNIQKTGTGFQETHTKTLTQAELRNPEMTVLRVSVSADALKSGADGQIRCKLNAAVIGDLFTLGNTAYNTFTWAFNILNPSADNTISIEVSPAGGTDNVQNFEIRATIIA